MLTMFLDLNHLGLSLISVADFSKTMARARTLGELPFGIMVRGIDNGLRDWSSIPGRVIPKTDKMVLDAALLNTQHYKVQIKNKRSNPPLNFGVVVIEKAAFGSPATTVGQLTMGYLYKKKII